MSQQATLPLKPAVEASPIYIGGASIEEIQTQYGLEQVIKIGSNESPLGPSPLAIAAMQRVAGALNRYPPIGDESLRELLAKTVGQQLEPDNFFTGNGGCDVLEMIATALINPGDECVICRPTFPVYEISARRAGGTIVYVDLNPDHFNYDVEAILAAVTEKTRLVYLCSPNNPTGNTLTAEQMETLVNNLPPSVLLVSDEVYYHFATADTFPNSVAHVKAGKNVVIIHSFSKAYGLAGLRLGYGIAPAALARYLSRTRKPFHLSKFVFEGGLAALRDQAHIKRTVELVTKGRQRLYKKLSGLDVQVWPSQGNFILFKPPFEATQVSERLLQRGVIVRPMTQFYLPTHLRVTIGKPEEDERFLAALQETLTELEAEGAPKTEEAAEPEAGEFKF